MNRMPLTGIPLNPEHPEPHSPNIFGCIKFNANFSGFHIKINKFKKNGVQNSSIL